MVAQPPIREAEAANWDFFLNIAETDRTTLSQGQVKDVQLLRPDRQAHALGVRLNAYYMT